MFNLSPPQFPHVRAEFQYITLVLPYTYHPESGTAFKFNVTARKFQKYDVHNYGNSLIPVEVRLPVTYLTLSASY